MSVDRRAIRAFVGRDWQAIAVSKASYWAERFQREGWRPAWDAADALLFDVRRTQPDFPTDSDRDRDFAHHLTLRAALDRAAHAITGR